jgi:hypothetical protein
MVTVSISGRVNQAAQRGPAGVVLADGSTDGRTDPKSLPCLYSNNCTESLLDNGKDSALDKVNKLTGGHRRTAFVLAHEIIQAAGRFGIERVGFLTLTFADHVTRIDEAQKRFHSLSTHVLKPRYKRSIAVVERQKSRRIHFHLVVVANADIRTGANFDAFAMRDYRSANLALRSEWAFWRKTAPDYRFGRTELLPVKSTAEGIGRYVGKYVSKHIAGRELVDKGTRLVRFIGYQPGDRTASSRFFWNNVRGWLWRHKLGQWLADHKMTLDQVEKIYGRRWAWFLQGEIYATRIRETFPNYSAANVDFDMACPFTVARASIADELEKMVVDRTYQLGDRNYASSKKIGDDVAAGRGVRGAGRG